MLLHETAVAGNMLKLETLVCIACTLCRANNRHASPLQLHPSSPHDMSRGGINKSRYY